MFLGSFCLRAFQLLDLILSAKQFSQMSFCCLPHNDTSSDESVHICLAKKMRWWLNSFGFVLACEDGQGFIHCHRFKCEDKTFYARELGKDRFQAKGSVWLQLVLGSLKEEATRALY